MFKMDSIRIGGLVLALALAGPTAAEAQLTRDWTNVCVGGTGLQTCASVSLSVSGGLVTLKAWNLSGTSVGGDRDAVITAISLANLPAGTTAGSLTMSTAQSSYAVGTSTSPLAPWVASTSGGTITVGRNSNTAITRTGYALDNGIASDCISPTTVTSGTRMFMTANPDGTCTATTRNSTVNAGWIVMNFSVNQTFNPDDPNLQLGLTSVDTQGSIYSGYVGAAYATPEPVTMVLLGSGLLGIGGARLRRRRRDEVLARA